MTVQTINIGNQVNDGLGDDLRTAFQKVNANFASLNSELTVTASNIGSTGSGVFKEKVGSDLQFKKLVSGTKMLLDDTGDSIVVNNIAPNAFTRITTDAGVMSADDYQNIAFSGTAAPGSTTSRKDIEVTVLGPIINFKTIIPVTDILTSYDFGSINGVYNNSMQAVYAATNMDFGTIDFPGRFDLDCGTIV